MRGRVESTCNGVITMMFYRIQDERRENIKGIFKIVPMELRSRYLWSWNTRIHGLEKEKLVESRLSE